MATFSWLTGSSGDWNTAANWSPATVPPNDGTAQVTIDIAPITTSYTVTIGASESVTVNSLAINNTDPNFKGANTTPYNAAQFEIDGTLTFGAGSNGLLDGTLQTFLVMNSGTIVNGGTLNAFIQALGNVLLTGTNGLYITNDLQALGGTVTVDTTSIAEMTGTTLFDGIFEAKGAGATVNLGGPLEHLIVNIATIEGPPLVSSGWTELTFNDPAASINEWNGTGYVSVESTLKEIMGGGTVDVLAGRNYNTSNTLTIDAGGGDKGPGMLNLQAGTVNTGGIDINGGVVQGFGTITGGVTNDGKLIALGGTMVVTGSLTGTGAVLFDIDNQAGTVDATPATLLVNGVSAGQTITMNGSDTLILNAPSLFAGTIAASVGDHIVLGGVTATGATLNNGTLVVVNGTQTLASIAMAGSFTGDHVTLTGSTVAIATGTVPPTITGTLAGQAVTDTGTIAPFANIAIADANISQTETVTVTLSAAANGSLTNVGGGTYNATSGVYTDVGTAAAITADLKGLVFMPTPKEVAPGQSVTTTFAIMDVDTGLASATDSTTTVVATAGTAVPPTIAGTVAGQTATPGGTIAPFAGVVIGDTNLGQTETVTVTLSAPGNGTLGNLGGGSYDAATGIYTAT
ncbi:MAG: hypothetical protein QOH05_291, partial [Acetobacteraceae bacterium]|nr:hypothetical protein [Acetobacteraceae bacterium]